MVWFPRVRERLVRKFLSEYFGRHFGFQFRMTMDGLVVFEGVNTLFDEGEKLAVRAVWRGESVLPASFYGRLYNDTPVGTDTLATLTGEMSGNGYAALAWTRNTSDFAAVTAGASGAWESIGVEKSYTASGGAIGPFTAFVMATSSDGTGVPFAWVQLNSSVTLPDTKSFGVSPKGGFRGVAA